MAKLDGRLETWLDGFPASRHASANGFSSYEYWQDGVPVSGTEPEVLVVVRPSSTNTAGYWTAVGNATLHGALADQNPNTYALANAAPSVDEFRVGFPAMSPPAEGSITFRVRHRRP